MKHIFTFCLLTTLTLPLIRAQEVIKLDLSAETIGEELIPDSFVFTAYMQTIQKLFQPDLFTQVAGKAVKWDVTPFFRWSQHVIPIVTIRSCR